MHDAAGRDRFHPGWGRVIVAIIAAAVLAGVLAIVLPGRESRDLITIGRRYEVSSRILGESREVFVHLPDGYEEDNGENGGAFPVLFKLFGNPPAYFAGLTGQIGTLMSFGDIPPLIVIGVEQRGHNEVLPRVVSPNEVPIRGEEFLQFMQNELIPWVDGTFATNGYRILLGTFDCGLFGVWSWLTAPETFDAVLVTEPGWGHEYDCVADWFARRDAAGSALDPFLHITEIVAPGRREDPFRPLLIAVFEEPEREYLRWEHTVLERESYDAHRNYTSCREGLLALFRGYRVTEEMLAEEIEDVDAWYRELSGRVGYPLPVPEMARVRAATVLSRQGRHSEAVEVLLRLQQQVPRSLNAAYMLAEEYQALGDRPRALASLRQGVELGLPPMFAVRLAELERSAASALEFALRSGSEESARRLYDEIVAGRRHDLEFVEDELNAAGYRLLQARLLPAAVTLFALATERFPESANAWDSLGEAVLAGGDRDRAIACYRRSLELDPGNANAAEVLRELGIEP